MNRISLIIVALVCALISSTSYAQALEEVTLTVSSDGPTKDEAVKNALRSAIEQAYGAFVSANTTILNDELVKDEIVTVSNGSIKEYKELACTPTQNEGQFVTLQATVSLPHLIQYSKSKGSECEFAGNAFGMQMKLFELQRKNELKALYNLTAQMEALLPTIMHHVIEVGEPKIPKKSWWSSDIMSDDGRYNRRIPYASSESDIDSIKYSSELFLRMDPKRKINHPNYWENIGFLSKEAESMTLSTIEHLNDYYEVPIYISWTAPIDKDTLENWKKQIEVEVEQILGESIHSYLHDEKEREKYIRGELCKALDKERVKRYLPIINTIENVLGSLSLSKDENISLKAKGLSTTWLSISDYPSYYLRNEPDSIYKWALDFKSKIIDLFCNFEIVDNTGQRSTFFPREVINRCINRALATHCEHPRYPNEVTDTSSVMLSGRRGILGEGLYHNLFAFKVNVQNVTMEVTGPDDYYNRDRDRVYFNVPFFKSSINIDDYQWETRVLIPKSEIGKYSNFKVEPAN